MAGIAVSLEQAFADLRSGDVQACAARASEVLAQDASQPQAHLLLGLVAFERGEFAAAAESLDRALTLGDSNFFALLYLIDVLRALDALTEDNLRTLVGHWARMRAPKEFAGQLRQLLEALKPSPARIVPEEIQATLAAIAVPALQHLLDAGDTDAALKLEMQLYNQFVKVIETEQHFGECTRRWVPMMTAAGRALALPVPPAPLPAQVRPKVAFVIHVAATEAHIEVVANILKGYRQLEQQSFEPVVFCLFNEKPEMSALFQPAGVTVQFLDRQVKGRSIVARLRHVRGQVAAQGIDTLVWVSNPIWMSLAFGMRLARKQVWFALKYHDLSTPDVDAYMTGGGMSRYKEFSGRQWRVGQAGYDNLFDAALTPAAQALRDELRAELRVELGAELRTASVGMPAAAGQRVILGTFGRAEKVRDPQFLAAVCRVLQQHPQALYLWAGREQDVGIQSAFEQAGVAAQTRFIGWVNTRLYAQVLDVFLDSFPFPCGFTLYEALMASVPCVLMATTESRALGLHGYISPVLAGEDGMPGDAEKITAIYALDTGRPRLLLSHTVEQWCAAADELIRDAGWRREVGNAGREFAESYLSGSKRCAASYAAHLDEIIRSP
ncbi:MAG: hypothetical protein QM800_06630 [Paludibacter sp.]